MLKFLKLNKIDFWLCEKNGTESSNLGRRQYFIFFLGLWDFLGYVCFDQIIVAGFWSHFQVNYSRRGRSRPGGFGRGGRTATSLKAQSVAGRELQARTELLARMRLNSLWIMIYLESVKFYLLRRRELYSNHTEKSPAVGKATETRQTKQVYLIQRLITGSFT